MTSPAPREQATAERNRRLLGWQAYDWMKTAVALLLAALLLYGTLAGENDRTVAPALTAAPTLAVAAAEPASTVAPTAAATSVVPPATALPTLTLAATAAPTVLVAAEPTATAAEPRPADVIVVTDVSGSMAADGKIDGVRAALGTFADLLGPEDRIALITFGDEADVMLPLTPIEEARGEVRRIARGLTPGGATTLYDTTLLAFDELQGTGDPTHTRVIIVLTDGRDERLNANDESIPGSEATLEQTLAGIEGGARQGIRLFTIGYGANADNAMLQRMADAANGKHFAAGPSTIQDVYKAIARAL